MRHLTTSEEDKVIDRVKAMLATIEPVDRLSFVAQAMYELNDGILQHSCGGYDWDISMDYRSVKDRS